jgi:hypothetical protein
MVTLINQVDKLPMSALFPYSWPMSNFISRFRFLTADYTPDTTLKGVDFIILFLWTEYGLASHIFELPSVRVM